MVIDVHCHAWPDQIAEKALAGRSPELPRFGDGTVSELRKALTASGVDNGVVLGISDDASRVDGVNRFVARQKAAGFFGFGTVHADLTPDQNLASLRENGVRGVKLHSLFQGFAYDDPRMMETFEAFGSEIAVIAHVGDGGDAAANARATPEMIRKIITTFPDLRLVACHFGGYHRLSDAEQELVGLGLMLETSWPPTLAGVAPELVKRIIDKHGAENIVFGSDWPMADPAAEIAAIRALGYSDEQTEGILGDNFLRFLGEDVERDVADRAANASEVHDV